MYQFKEVKLKNAKKQGTVLAIGFDEPAYAIVGEFLMSDASMFDYAIIKDIEAVLNDEKEVVKTSGNRCALTIRKDTTKIEDLLDGMFDDVVTYEPIVMSTKELKHLTNVWKQKAVKFAKKLR